MTAAWRPAALATAAAGARLVFQVMAVHHGRISGLFYTGANVPLPSPLEGHTARVNDPVGYDAQYYHIVEHDPLLRRGFQAYVDNPPLRWRRIAVPALAFGCDSLYVAIQLGFVFVGAYWLGRFAARPEWGFGFLVVPAVLVSLERMTVDLPLAALVIAFVLYGGWPVYLVMAVAPLVRETGMLLAMGWCAHALLRREWRRAALGAACAAPALAWWAYVHSRTPPDGTPWLAAYPFAGIVGRTLAGVTPADTAGLRLAAILEMLTLAGLWLALGCVAWLAWKRRCGLAEITALLFAAFASTLGKSDIWDGAYATGRTMSPLLILLGLIALRDHRPVLALPLAAILPRILFQNWGVVNMALQP